MIFVQEQGLLQEKPYLTEAKNFPLYSIITVTMNNYTGLVKTFESLEKQNLKDFEWLVIDGGSTDETVGFLRKIRSETRTDKYPFRFVSQPDEGLYDAMNTGITMARGHYLFFLNAADTLADAKTLSVISVFCQKTPPPGFIYGDSYEQSNDHPKNARKPVAKSAFEHKKIEWGMFTHHQAMLYRRHIIRDERMRYSLRFKIASDYDFTARFLKKCSEISYINQPICIFETGGISQQNSWQGRKEQYIIRENLEITSPLKNLWILFVQTLSWQLKSYCPWLYHLLKPCKRSTLF